jgi:hypothetical protein
METIIVSWQNGIRFSVKRKLSLHKRSPSKLSWNEYIVSNWRYRCKIVFKAFLPKRFATCFIHCRLSFRCEWAVSSTVSKVFRCKWTVSVLFRKRCNTVAKSLLHKRRVETFLSISAWFSLQIRFKQKVATDIWVKTKNRFHPFATINFEKYP